MFCPQCGTKTVTGSQRFCRECGAEISPAAGQDQTAQGAQATQGTAQGPFNQACGASYSTLRPCAVHVSVRDNPMKTLLMAGGLLLLLPLAIPLVFGLLIAGVAAGVGLVALAIHLLPVLALAAVVYWIVAQRRTVHSGR